MANIRKVNVNERLWNDLINRIYSSVNILQQHSHARGSYNYTRDPRGSIVNNNTTAVPTWSHILSIGKNIANQYRFMTRGLYGITGTTWRETAKFNQWGWPRDTRYNAYGYFFVYQDRHQAHVNLVNSSISNLNPNYRNTNITLSSITTTYQQLSNIIINNRNHTTPDLRVCHSSCHSSCHNSRGRR